MRTSAFAVVIVVLTSLPSILHADNDFSALLADLTFGDEPTLQEPLAVVPTEPVEELKPVPTGIRMPMMLESAHDIADLFSVIGDSGPTPRVALQDPVVTNPPVASGSIDLNTAFALQAESPARAATPAQVVGHPLHPMASPHGCQTPGCAEPCQQPGMTCRPRTNPNIPSSTFLQYFRSDACYTNVWDGYGRNCRHHSHIHGTCDCFNRSNNCQCGEVIDCVPAGCASCDVGCDQ